MYKGDKREVPVSKENFDLVIHLGELGSEYRIENDGGSTRKITIPPFTVLPNEDLLDRNSARDELGLDRDGRYALLTLGPGNLKDVSDIGLGLVAELQRHGFTPVWARSPISAADVELPDGVIEISVYPLLRVMRAFDAIVSAAGYNTCCEIMQTGIPTLFVPNTLVADDQTARAKLVSSLVPAVVSPCETGEQRAAAIGRLLRLEPMDTQLEGSPRLDGAEIAASEILSLLPSTNAPG